MGVFHDERAEERGKVDRSQTISEVWPTEARVSGRRYVAYYRVSTKRQGCSELGLEAQRHAVYKLVRSGCGELVAEYSEVGSGRKNDRSQLREAFATCRVRNAILAIARLDRLSRRVRIEKDGTGSSSALNDRQS
jgi:hypothetical protein